MNGCREGDDLPLPHAAPLTGGRTEKRNSETAKQRINEKAKNRNQQKERGCTLIVPRFYEDLSVLHQNAMPDRAYFIPASCRNDTLIRHRENSDRLQMLSGCDWDFAWYPSIHDLQDLFYLPDYDPGKQWKKEKVPFCWQLRGYDSAQYTNIRYPFPFDPPYVPQDNPCGAYLHHFEWHRDQEAPLCFSKF